MLTLPTHAPVFVGIYLSQDVYFELANFDGASLRNTNIITLHATGASFRGTDMSFANITDSVFITADLQFATFEGSNLALTDFTRANLNFTLFRNVLGLSPGLTYNYGRPIEFYGWVGTPVELVTPCMHPNGIDVVDCPNGIIDWATRRRPATRIYRQRTDLTGRRLVASGVHGRRRSRRSGRGRGGEMSSTVG